MSAVLEVQEVSKIFESKKAFSFKPRYSVKALKDVSFSIARGETLGIVGESGCGKSTLARCVMDLIKPTTGNVLFDGEDFTHADIKRQRALRSRIQMVFQDPYSSLNPRRTIGQSLAEPLKVHSGINYQQALPLVLKVLDEVGLPANSADKYPQQFSGGQRQRVAIARALILEPELVIADEAVSALDVSVQAQILLLLRKIQEERNLSYLFITHDLGVVRNFCDRVIVMYLGSVVESGKVCQILESPRHPYARSLRDAAPIPDVSKRGKIELLEGEIPSPGNPPSGCTFHPRCPKASEKCRKEVPVIETDSDMHSVACHHPFE